MLLIQKSELHKEDISHSQLLDHISSNIGATQTDTLKLVFFPGQMPGKKYTNTTSKYLQPKISIRAIPSR
jgi:hypothetical protein